MQDEVSLVNVFLVSRIATAIVLLSPAIFLMLLYTTAGGFFSVLALLVFYCVYLWSVAMFVPLRAAVGMRPWLTWIVVSVALGLPAPVLRFGSAFDRLTAAAVSDAAVTFTGAAVFAAAVVGLARASRRYDKNRTIDLAFPLSGGIFEAVQAGSTRFVNHHAISPAQRYGVDLVKVRPNGLRFLLPRTVEAFPIYGLPVLSPLAGAVRGAVDEFDDQRALGARDARHPFGNYVVIENADGVRVVFAHLQRGTRGSCTGGERPHRRPVGIGGKFRKLHRAPPARACGARRKGRSGDVRRTLPRPQFTDSIHLGRPLLEMSASRRTPLGRGAILALDRAAGAGIRRPIRAAGDSVYAGPFDSIGSRRARARTRAGWPRPRRLRPARPKGRLFVRRRRGRVTARGRRPAGRDPLALLAAAEEDRLKRLLPLKNARMEETPFTFFRGSAVIMAADLAHTPVSGLTVQACGDAHCLNFGGFATPERNLIFDLNDFDETMPGPWEWDLKRLVTSVLLAGRQNGFKERSCEIAVLAAAEAYRRAINELAQRPALDVFYARLNAEKILDAARDTAIRLRRDRIADEAATASVHAAVERFTEGTGDERRFKEDPPILFHSAETDRAGFDIEAIFAQYAQTLGPDVSALFDRYTLIDHAIKVVGVGSVGTRCGVGLFTAGDDDMLILQVKEARESVLQRHLGQAAYTNQGERVVRGQRLMQAASDVFLGWASSAEHDFYVRQFKDMKASADLAEADQYQLREYAHWCAWALATAHARSGDAAAIAGYAGRRNPLDRALLAFAIAYAEQVERDHAAFTAAIETGKVEATASP